MVPENFAKQMIAFQKSTFNNTFNALLTLEQQNEKVFNSFMDQSNWIPENGKQAMVEWVESYKKGREDFKNVIDENFKKVEAYFVSPDKGVQEKPKTQAK